MQIPRRIRQKLVTFIILFLLPISTISTLNFRNSKAISIRELDTFKKNQDIIFQSFNQDVDSSFMEPKSKLSSFFSLSNKIDSKLIEISNNLPLSTEVKIIVYFQDHISKNNRIELLKTWFPKVKIGYNYDILPCTSIEVENQYLAHVIHNIENFRSIRFLSQDHRTNLASSRFQNLFSDNSKWNAPFSDENWWLDAIGMSNVNYTGKGIKLAIMDTGISVHPDFFEDGNPSQSRIFASKNFTYERAVSIEDYTYDCYGHGTHCAGIAGGNGITSNGKFRGVAPEVEFINAKISNSSGTIEESDVVAAIEWCMEIGVQIISMSFGLNIPEVWNVETLAIQKAVESGIVVVTSAGNSGPNFYTAGTPGTGLYSISVGATDINNHVASFSSVGPSFSNQIGPDICAPGVNIISTDSLDSILSLDYTYANPLINSKNKFGYIPLSGTSMACPMVAGAVAILLEAFPESTPESIRNALIKGSSVIERPSPEGYGAAQGAGLINVSKSLDYLGNIKKQADSVNNQVLLFPRQIPYAPFDLLRFPGDYQGMNFSIYSGSECHISIELPNLVGIEFNTPENEFSLDYHGIISFPLEIHIKNSAVAGNRLGTVNITDRISNRILDSVLINISIAIPKQKIYFESFHGLNDLYPSESPIYSQIQLYNMMYDLSHQNYSISYKMQNWTSGYFSSSDAEILSPRSLADIDLLILQTPILAYSEFERTTIVNFFNRGGSILFLGTKSNKMCIDSINSLFSALNSGISITEKNIFNFRDYSIGASVQPYVVSNLDQQHSIFSNIDSFKFLFGNSFETSGNAEALASIDGKCVVSCYDSTENGKGKIVAFGDYHTFGNSYYNDPTYYSNHSKLLLNLVDYLMPLDPIEISHDFERQNTTENYLNISINVFNNNINEFEDEFIPGESINTTIIYGNGTESPLSNQIEKIDNHFNLNLFLENEATSQEALRIVTKIAKNSEIFQDSFEFYYYPYQIQGYSNITDDNVEINRSIESTPALYVNSPSNNQLESYISIYSDSYLASNRLSELKGRVSIHDLSDFFYKIQINSSEITTGGEGYAYCFTQDNSSTQCIDFSPDRFLFSVQNYIPEIDFGKSLFSNVKFSTTQSGGSIYPISAKLGTPYSLTVFTEEKVSFEDSNEDLTVVASIVPILVYNGFINLLNPQEFPTLNFEYNSEDNSHRSVFSFPESLNYSRAGNIRDQSLQTDMNNYFTLLWITVRDSDGGSSSEFLLFYLYYDIPNLNNFLPIIIVLALLGVSIIIINYKSHIFKKNQTMKF
ncbi:S8 family serine peptidase [Candidatus Lokiarchaeum ossiferum]|uniref:S8 family serine peptidase n=1 Tax=Candidatus Lokiarchaeum ossiferum TaxID=2951803 RepID=UPI00352D87AD